MGVIERWKQRARVQAEHEEEINTLHEEYAKKIRAINDSNKRVLDRKNEVIVDLGKEREDILKMADVDKTNLREKLREAEAKLEAQLTEKDRVEKLLTKINKRAGTYRTMMKAVAAWEEEIHVEREDDKLEEFIKWKNENGYG